MMEWQVAEKDHQTYGFFYDSNNRLLEAEYGERATSTSSYSLNHRYRTEYSYFDNGDLHTLSRKGRLADGTFTVIDDLTYSYYADKTRLQDVDDDASATDNIRDYGFGYYDITATGADYTYDANGNITYDPSKGLTITYNHLNLPAEVTKAGGGSIAWLYDANGNKLRKTSQPDALSLSGTIPTGVYQADQITSDGTVPTGATVVFRAGTEIELQAGFETQTNSDFEATIAITGSGVQDYVGGIEYRDGDLEAIYHECGRLFFGGSSSPRYEYTITDHLGNSRVTFADLNGDGQVDASEVLQENQYYPFGMQMEGDWLEHSDGRNLYQFNGIERNEDLGLNWDLAEFRSYDAAIGRWTQVDPMAELAPNVTPYRFGFNNPVFYFDPFGLFETRAEAVAYAKEHGLRRGLFNSNIKKQSDGTYAIENRKDHSFTARDSELGVITGALASAPRDGYSTSSSLLLYSAERREPYSGFWGGVEYFLSDGIENGLQYNRDGYPLRIAPLMGEPPGPGKARGAVKLLQSGGKTVRHHIFNVFRGKSLKSRKYREFFKKHGIELDEHTIHIPEKLHKQIHAAGNNWTTKWKRWIDANPNASTKDVYQQAGRMMEEYGIQNYKILPFN
jgi:RHS repeat-associated protein